MNEIEKLYENAGVKPIDIAEYGSTYIPKKIEINGKPYPPFTAEKQLELIKFLSEKCDLVISHFDKWEIVHYTGDEPFRAKHKKFE